MNNLKMSEEEDLYYKEGKSGLSGSTSLLSSNSKWLNSLVLRDAIAQDNLRRNGDDVGALQLVPEVMNEYHKLLDVVEVDALMQQQRELKPEFSTWMDRREQTLLDLATADKYPAGTLGALLRDFYRSTGFAQILAYKDLVPTSDFEYYNKQRTLVHDIEHLVTGFGTDPAGELGMMYMYMTINSRYFSAKLAGVLNFIHAYLASSWTMRTNLHYSNVLPAFMESIEVGLAMGNALDKPLPLADWERYFDWPIEEVRKDLNLVAADPARWAWTDAAWRG